MANSLEAWLAAAALGISWGCLADLAELQAKQILMPHFGEAAREFLSALREEK